MIDESSDIDRRRLLIPGLAGLYGALGPLAYALVRVVIGLTILPGGIDKMFYGGYARIATGNIAALGLSWPYAWAWAVAGIEFFGAIMLILGLFTRPTAFATLVMLLVISFGIMINRGLFWTTGGMEVALLLAVPCLAFVVSGGGRYSLDRLIGREF